MSVTYMHVPPNVNVPVAVGPTGYSPSPIKKKRPIDSFSVGQKDPAPLRRPSLAAPTSQVSAVLSSRNLLLLLGGLFGRQ